MLVALRTAKCRSCLRFDHSWEPRVALIWNFQTVSLGNSVNKPVEPGMWTRSTGT